MEENNITSTANQNYAIPISIVIAGLAIALAIYFADTKKDAPQPSEQRVNAVIAPVSPSDHIIGNPNAKVIIVEYSDTECPFCKSFHPTMQRIMNEYGNDGQVAWVYRHFPLPFHPKANKEAEASECANKLGGNTKFWEYINKLFEITPGNNQLDPTELPKIAKAIGLDEVLFNKCIESDEMKAIVDKDLTSGRNAGINGTPFSIILLDAKAVSSINGAQSYESVKAQIEQVLKK